ncbi:hypothetical protein GCM10009743_25330 [Kribbella swartbergensis]
MRIDAREGEQMEFVQYVASIRTPWAASRSRCGVRLTLLPYAEIACAAWSSDMTKTMLGNGVMCPASDIGGAGAGYLA